MVSESIGAGPYAIRMILGSRLRRQRENLGIQIDTAAKEIGMSRWKLARIELGQVSTKRADLTKLLDYYQLGDELVRNELRTLAHQANLPGWWELVSLWLPEGLDQLLSLEPVAWRILVYEQRLVPELLQTADYARAALRMTYPDQSEAQIEALVTLQQRRQQHLAQSGWPRGWFLIEEAALRTRVGGEQVWQHQLDHLIELSRRGSICLQVVREEVAGRVRLDHGFTYLMYTDGNLSDMVSFRRLNCFEYIEHQKQTQRYYEHFNRLAVRAERPGDNHGDTTEFIQALLDNSPVPPIRSEKFRFVAASGPDAPPPPD